MKTLRIGMLLVVGMSVPAWAQEGNKERGKEGKGEKEPSILLVEVDTNKDGKASVTEIRAALARLSGAKETKKEGDGNRERREGGKEGKGAPEAAILLKDLDTNKDNRATAKELQVALDGLLNPKKDGEKKDGDKK